MKPWTREEVEAEPFIGDGRAKTLALLNELDELKAALNEALLNSKAIDEAEFMRRIDEHCAGREVPDVALTPLGKMLMGMRAERDAAVARASAPDPNDEAQWAERLETAARDGFRAGIEASANAVDSAYERGHDLESRAQFAVRVEREVRALAASIVTVDTGTGPYQAGIGTEKMPLPEPDAPWECPRCGARGSSPSFRVSVCGWCGTGKAKP